MKIHQNSIICVLQDACNTHIMRVWLYFNLVCFNLVCFSLVCFNFVLLCSVSVCILWFEWLSPRGEASKSCTIPTSLGRSLHMTGYTQTDWRRTTQTQSGMPANNHEHYTQGCWWWTTHTQSHKLATKHPTTIRHAGDDLPKQNHALTGVGLWMWVHESLSNSLSKSLSK